jgi:hypothetical protein
MREQAAGQFPRVYRPSPGWQALLAVCGVILLVLGSSVGWIALPGHSNGSWALLILIPIAIAFCCLSAYSLATVWRYRVVLTVDHLEYQLLSRTTVKRNQIRGWRIASTIPPTLILERADGRNRSVKIGRLFPLDDVLSDWIDSLPSIDEEESTAYLDEIENGRSLGQSPAERTNRVKRMSRYAQVLNGFSIAAVLLAFFYPHPYRIAMLVMIALPWVALVLVKLSRGLIRIDEKKNDPHPTVAYAYMFPGFALALRAVSDFNVIQSTHAAVLFALVAAALTFFAVAANRSLRQKKPMIALLLVLTAAYGYGAVVEADALLDSSAETVYATQLLSMHIDHGKHTSYHLELGSWGPKFEPNDIEVDADIYGALRPGFRIHLALRHGALGVPWFYIKDWQSN